LSQQKVPLNKDIFCCGKPLALTGDGPFGLAQQRQPFRRRLTVSNTLDRSVFSREAVLGKIVNLIAGMPIEFLSVFVNLLDKITRMPLEFLGVLFDLCEKLCSKDDLSWLENLKRFLRKEPCWQSIIIAINHGRFPKEFVGVGWSIIAAETDTYSTALTELDPTKVQFVTMLNDSETSIRGEEKLKRLKSSGYIRLDADVFLTLWENKHLIPESWKEKVKGKTRCIFFDGTVLRDSDGCRYVLYLYWRGGAWCWRMRWLDLDWLGNFPSAVLAS
jgi:hypothetical protein